MESIKYTYQYIDSDQLLGFGAFQIAAYDLTMPIYKRARYFETKSIFIVCAIAILVTFRTILLIKQ